MKSVKEVMNALVEGKTIYYDGKYYKLEEESLSCSNSIHGPTYVADREEDVYIFSEYEDVILAEEEIYTFPEAIGKLAQGEIIYCLESAIAFSVRNGVLMNSVGGLDQITDRDEDWSVCDVITEEEMAAPWGVYKVTSG